ncbi:heme biosynthesis protein HemY [Salinicola halophyticus]|uniref:heme biosynthesis protein HemY n=1 Tax=Salinicola halophyticus TaxID=1808881 RepID=UPI003F488B50
MSSTVVRDLRKRCLTLMAAGLIGFGGVPSAQAEGPALRPDMIQTLHSMQSQLEAGDDAAVASRAAASASRLQGGNAADRWAQALFLQLAASANARQGNDSQAADQLAEARGIDEVPDARRLAWLRQEAQLRLSAGQTEQGADRLTQWVERSGGDDTSRWLLVQARASLREWSAAANSLDRLRESGAEGWSSSQQQLASTVYQQTGRFDDALALLGDDASSPDVWRRAAGLAQRAGDDGRAAAIWESGWRRGALTSRDDLLQLAKLHIAGGTPARAAEYLQRWLDDGQLESSPATLRLTAQAWTAARDHDQALTAWRKLAEQSGRAEDWQQLAELAYGWGEWQTTLDAFLALREAGGDMSGRDWLLQGIATVQLDDQDAARVAFRRAKAAGVDQAQQWLDSLG